MRFQVLREGALVLAFAVAFPAPLRAAANTGAAFLKIDTGARPAALGGAYTALAEDVNALSYNPGGLAGIQRRELGATHAQWLLGSTFDFFGFVQPTGMGTFGLGVTRLAVGSAEARGPDRQAAGSFDASDTAYSVGFGRFLGEDFGSLSGTGLGLAVKLLHSRIGAYSASAVAFDLGLRRVLPGRPLTCGVSALNLGNGMRFLDQNDPLPLTLSAGAAYRVSGFLGLVLDVRHEVYDRATSVGLGTEYALLPKMALRAGYGSRLAVATGGSPLDGLNGGLGLLLGRYRADYTFTPFALGQTQRVSLGVSF